MTAETEDRGHRPRDESVDMARSMDLQQVATTTDKAVPSLRTREGLKTRELVGTFVTGHRCPEATSGVIGQATVMQSGARWTRCVTSQPSIGLDLVARSSSTECRIKTRIMDGSTPFHRVPTSHQVPAAEAEAQLEGVTEHIRRPLAGQTAALGRQKHHERHPQTGSRRPGPHQDEADLVATSTAQDPRRPRLHLQVRTRTGSKTLALDQTCKPLHRQT